MTVLLRSEIDTASVDLDRVREKAELLLHHSGYSDSELSILLVSDDKMTELNAAYRHKNSPTNVLSFPMMDDDTPSLPALLGDIVISLDTAIRESAEKHIPLDSYLAVLLVHGFSHLLGYDHERNDKAAREMAGFEQHLLAKLNPDYKNPLTN